MEIALPVSLLLLCAAATPSARSGGFPAPDEAPDEGGRRAAERIRLPARFDRAVAAPTCAAGETAALLGIAVRVEPAIADIDHGDWAGRAFADLRAEDMAAWLADPVKGAPGGESMHTVRERVGPWLDAVSEQAAAQLAITHPTVIRAAIAHALDMPLAATLAIDIAPLSGLQMSFNRRWRLQSIGPLPQAPKI